MRPIDRLILIAIAASLAAIAARPLIGADRAHAAALAGDEAIAVCAMPTLINELMASERFAPRLANVAPDLQEELADLIDERTAIREDLERDFDPEDPEDQQNARRYRELDLRINALQRQVNAAAERRSAELFAEAYALIRSSADAVGEDLGFDYVIATGDPDERLANDVNTVLRQISARPVLRHPKGVDITDDVRDDLNLD